MVCNKTTYSDNLIFVLLKPRYFCHKMGGFIVKFGILNIRNIGYPCRKLNSVGVDLRIFHIILSCFCMSIILNQNLDIEYSIYGL